MNQIALRHPIFFFVTLFSFWGIFAIPAYSQNCDPSLVPTKHPATAYKKRQNRCEGFYSRRKVSGSLELAGFYQGDWEIPWKKEEVVVIQPAFSQDKIFRIRAVAIPLKTHYRLDAELPANKNLEWPIGDVVFPQKLYTEKIGIYSWFQGKEEKIYVPVRLTTSLTTEKERANQEIWMILKSDVKLKQVKWRLGQAEKKQCKEIGAWNKTKKKSYGSGKAIPLLMPSSKTGEFCLHVLAKEKRSGDPIHKELRIMLPPL